VREREEERARERGGGDKRAGEARRRWRGVGGEAGGGRQHGKGAAGGLSLDTVGDYNRNIFQLHTSCSVLAREGEREREKRHAGDGRHHGQDTGTAVRQAD